MIDKKYEFIHHDTICSCKTQVFRIKALRDFGNVRKGDLGGYIVSEDCLAHRGNCWVGPDAIILNNCSVKDDALVTGDVLVVGNVHIGGNAKIMAPAGFYDVGHIAISSKSAIFICEDALIKSQNDFLILFNSGTMLEGCLFKTAANSVKCVLVNMPHLLVFVVDPRVEHIEDIATRIGPANHKKALLVLNFIVKFFSLEVFNKDGWW